MGRLGFSSSSISIYHYEHIFRKPERSCAVKIPVQEPSTPPVWDSPDFNQQTLPGQEMGPSHQPILWEMRTCFCRYWWVTEEVGRHWRSVHLPTDIQLDDIIPFPPAAWPLCRGSPLVCADLLLVFPFSWADRFQQPEAVHLWSRKHFCILIHKIKASSRL